MILLPYEKFVIKTYLAPDIILKRLAEATEPSSKWAFFWQRHKPYQGKIRENEFEIHRWSSYRNDFRPMIHGNINPERGGSSVYVVMTMHWSMIIFMCIWLSLFLLALLASIVNTLTVSQSSVYSFNWFVCVAPTFSLLFIYLMPLVSFKVEATKSRKFLGDLLESDDVTELGLLETELDV